MEIIRNYSRKVRALDVESGSRSSIPKNVIYLIISKLEKHFEIVFILLSRSW